MALGPVAEAGQDPCRQPALVRVARARHQLVDQMHHQLAAMGGETVAAAVKVLFVGLLVQRQKDR